MIKYHYGKAPIHYIDGLPAHKAGEWPGILSSKFHSYKRVIRPEDCGIFKFLNNSEITSQKRPFRKSNSTNEIVYRGIKIIPPYVHKEKFSNIKCKFEPFPQKNEHISCKRLKFPYIENKRKLIESKNSELDNNSVVLKEFHHIAKIGFVKKDVLTNWELNQKINKTKRGNNFNNLFHEDNNVYDQSNKNINDDILNIKSCKINDNTDQKEIDYVKKLA